MNFQSMHPSLWTKQFSESNMMNSLQLSLFCLNFPLEVVQSQLILKASYWLSLPLCLEYFRSLHLTHAFPPNLIALATLHGALVVVGGGVVCQLFPPCTHYGLAKHILFICLQKYDYPSTTQHVSYAFEQLRLPSISPPRLVVFSQQEFDHLIRDFLHYQIRFSCSYHFEISICYSYQNVMVIQFGVFTLDRRTHIFFISLLSSFPSITIVGGS